MLRQPLEPWFGFGIDGEFKVVLCSKHTFDRVFLSPLRAILSGNIDQDCAWFILYFLYVVVIDVLLKVWKKFFSNTLLNSGGNLRVILLIKPFVEWKIAHALLFLFFGLVDLILEICCHHDSRLVIIIRYLKIPWLLRSLICILSIVLKIFYNRGVPFNKVIWRLSRNIAEEAVSKLFKLDWFGTLFLWFTSLALWQVLLSRVFFLSVQNCLSCTSWTWPIGLLFNYLGLQ